MLLAASSAAVVAVVAGCSGLGQSGSDTGNQQGYVSGDGTVTVLAATERGAPVALTGETTRDEVVDVAAWRGQVVVINVWYANCAPCRSEAKALAAVAQDSPDVRFLGVNTDDGLATAHRFESQFGVPYSSILDASSGQALLALSGSIPPQAVPSTVVLDTEGRPAARVIGKVEQNVLRGIVDDVRSGRADGGEETVGASS